MPRRRDDARVSRHEDSVGRTERAGGPGGRATRKGRDPSADRAPAPCNALVLVAREMGPTLRSRLLVEGARRHVNVLDAPVDVNPQVVDASLSAFGADSIGVCGPPFMQATIASVASGRGLPFTCVPTGADDVFARDLGMPPGRPDVVLDLLTEAEARYVDLAEVNGIVFVNCVRLRLETARVGPNLLDARLRILDRDDAARGASLRDWRAHASPGSLTLVVSNNRFTGRDGIESRARLDTGQLGVALVQRSDTARERRQTTTHVRACRHLELPADGLVLAEIDGRRHALTPPVRLRALPVALRTCSRATPRRPS